MKQVMAEDTTEPSYWLNWRFFLCAIWILAAMVFAAVIIWKHEGRRESENCSSDDQHKAAGILYDAEVWGTCSTSLHPIWLLAYRIVAFSLLLSLLLADLVISGAGKFYFYTEWTFTLVTIYFGLAFTLSIRGTMRCRHEVELDRDNFISPNAEHGSYVRPSPQLGHSADTSSPTGSAICYGEPNSKNIASIWGYVLQIIFQMSAGAVLLTDSVFWLILYPSLLASAYKLNFMIVCKHSANAALLLGDGILNRLRFPFFRVAYFVLWTCMYVLFQWIIHACVSLRWPYPFLELSSPYAPLWYLGISLLVFPCYGIITLLFRLKQRYCLNVWQHSPPSP